MKKLLLLLSAILFLSEANAQFNNLWIPDTISGTTFNLTVNDTFAQLKPGNQTITAGINNSQFWGPTLIFNKGDIVHLNVLSFKLFSTFRWTVSPLLKIKVGPQN